ncbi:MAG: hypothetical protein LBQ50_08015, partial [Planctomycetaceae bacterium]|nr:hypothetical protein [Planctomycetaceae bacterium]
MANLQILIDNIRMALAHSEFINPDVIRGYASEYAAECVKLNDRVKQCVPFLHSGNLAEAVRLAEAPPNIVETYTLLDFEGRNDWVEIVDNLGFDVPPPLPTEQFTQLNDAYVQIAPLDNLLKQHRYHALNGSPLQEKLSILRKIAKADPKNFFWSEDQEKWEKVRLVAFGKEVQQAVSSKNDYQIMVLYNELIDPNWRIAPPPQYRTALCTAVLQGYAEMLLNHFNTFDYDRTLNTHQQMQSICQTNGMAMPQPLEMQIRPVIQWLQETTQQNNAESSFQNACEELRGALDDDETLQRKLENLFYALQNAATQAGQNIPPDLIQHYELRVSSLEQKTTMRR